jgi:PKD repeat protein
MISKIDKISPILNKHIILLLILSSFFILPVKVNAQLSVPGKPMSFEIKTKAAFDIPSTTLTKIDIPKLLLEDSLNGIDNRYGIRQNIYVDMKKEGLKISIPGKGNLWLYKIFSVNAYSLGIQFANYLLPAGASVFIYNESETQLAGAFTDLNNTTGGNLAIADFKGKNAVIEYFEPLDAEFAGELVIGSVSQSYRDLDALVQWRISINCPQGNNWQLEKHAVCKMTFTSDGHDYYCTGSLINNARSDGTPYFLTANHCISKQVEASSLVLYFNFEKVTCDGSESKTAKTLSGATLIANNKYSDFSLLRINDSPPPSYSPYFAGWDATGSISAKGTCIHHPDGTEKCISIDNNQITSYTLQIIWQGTEDTSAANTHWRCTFDDGRVEGGSSGSPMFNSDKKIIGQLHGGDSQGALNFFGKFDVSWSRGISNNTKLSPWLDPDNSGTLIMDGYYDFMEPKAAFKIDPEQVCINSTIKFIDQSKYLPINWKWNISPTTYLFTNHTGSTSQNPEVVFLKSGIYSITLVVSSDIGKDSIAKINYLEVKDSLGLNLSGFKSDTSLCACELTNHPVVATGMLNYSFDYQQTDKLDTNVIGNNLYLAVKPGLTNYGSFDTWIKATGTYGACRSTDSIKLHIIMPKNDDIENAFLLNLGENGPYSNYCAGIETNEPNPGNSSCSDRINWCGNNNQPVKPISNTIWFSFQGPLNGIITINTNGYGNRICVYEANNYSDIISGNESNYKIIASNDNGSDNGGSMAIEKLNVTPEKKYWIQLDGINGGTGNYGIGLYNNNLDIYPNPSNGKFDLLVSYMKEGSATIEVFSSLGCMVLKQKVAVALEANHYKVNLSNQSQGIYYIRVTFGEIESSGKFMIVK